MNRSIPLQKRASILIDSIVVTRFEPSFLLLYG